MKQIIVNVMPEETRLALLEDDKLIGLELERPHHSHLVGNIYKGQVQNVLKGMQAAFVDIGHSKNAFLYIADGKIQPSGKNGERKTIHVGQNILVQITKDEVGTKGPRATMHLSIPGRNVVLMPRSPYIGTSHRIEDEAERQRLYDIVRGVCPKDMGIIIRTAAIGQSAEAIQQDIQYLLRIWDGIAAKAMLSNGGRLLYRDADLVIRIVRDCMTEDVDSMLIDDPEVYRRVVELLEGIAMKNPSVAEDLVKRIKLYADATPIFEHYGIDEQRHRLMGRKVELESGGFLVIDKTEAMTVIDVNTGRFTGDVNLAETAYTLNVEAAEEIMRQLRLRDLGGMVVVDFIDMEKPRHREALLEFMRQRAQRDRVKTNVLDITALGLVEITRKKSRQNVDGIVYCECPVCQGNGFIESVETLAVRLCRKIRELEHRHHAANGYLLQLHPEAASELRSRQEFDHLYRDLGVNVEVQSSREVMPGAYILTSK